MKFFNFLKNKKKDQRLDQMENEKPLIETLINHHFCIKDSNSIDILKVLDSSTSENILFDATFNWDFLFDETDKNFNKHFLLFDKINEWNYLRWNVWDFEETIKMTLHLSKELNTKVCYFFIDPWIVTCRWFIAENGKIKETYFESHGKMLSDRGNWESVKTDNNQFWEDKFWDIYKKECQSIEVINKRKTIQAIKGKLK